MVSSLGNPEVMVSAKYRAVFPIDKLGGATEPVRKFVFKLMAEARKYNIPLRLVRVAGDVVEVEHFDLKKKMTPLQWGVIGQLGKEAGRKNNYPCQWLGEGGHNLPECFAVNG